MKKIAMHPGEYIKLHHLDPAAGSKAGASNLALAVPVLAAELGMSSFELWELLNASRDLTPDIAQCCE